MQKPDDELFKLDPFSLKTYFNAFYVPQIHSYKNSSNLYENDRFQSQVFLVSRHAVRARAAYLHVLQAQVGCITTVDCAKVIHSKQPELGGYYSVIGRQQGYPPRRTLSYKTDYVCACM